jgi:glycosyltransferase involved in cell wall biosynthesis
MDRRETWVVVPCYNEERWIGQTIDALAAQSFRDFTLALVDNGSTDRTPAVIESSLSRHPGLDAVVLQEPEKGTGCAADTGFRYAIQQGAEIVYRTDADCLPRPTWLEEIKCFMEDRDLDAAGGRLEIRTDDVNLNWLQLLPSRLGIRLIPWVGRIIPSNRGEGYLSPYVLLPGPNVAIRSEAYVSCGGYPRQSFDHEFLDKAIANALRRVTPRIGVARRAVVLYSERRTEAYGILGAIRWLLDRSGREGATDVR